ncbi:MAG: Tfp pilus assembly protein FimT/FimU [Desulfovibrionales bacterium]
MPTLTSRAGNWGSPRGYTLIELAIVVLILSIGVGLLMPRFSSGLFVNDTKLSLRRIKAAVTDARNTAMIAGKSQTLVLEFGQDGGKSCWWLEQVEPAADASQGFREPKKTCLPDGIRLSRVQKSDGKVFESGRVPLLFLPNGLTEPVFLHLGTGQEITTVAVKPFNARVEVMQGGHGVSGTGQEFPGQ